MRVAPASALKPMVGPTSRRGAALWGGRAGRTAYPAGVIPQYLTVAEAAQRLGLTSRTVWRWCQRGVLESVKLGRGRRGPVRIAEPALARLIARHRRPARATEEDL